ncbi:MAG: linear amide C-N hydrolase [Ruminococcaceae bacterium]|nr:linear amide C-N hydrolase [Oscillospiraceae bacterium]
MCTAITYQSGDFYFGRNLDLDRDYGERVTVMPRKFTFPMKCMPDLCEHYAMIGMAVVAEGCPLFFEATNEKGLSMAGLNFPDNAFYCKVEKGRLNLAPYELIPWLLGKCATLSEVKEAVKELNIVNIPFSESVPLSPLHWIIADKSGSLTVESMSDGLKIHENPWGVLSNNPPFDYHQINAEKFNLFKAPLPGDFSSETRFLRAAYLKEKSSPKESEDESVGQFFRILSLVSVPEGCVVKNGKPHFTRYSSCCNTDKGIFYYNRCGSFKIKKADMHDYDLEGKELLIPEST